MSDKILITRNQLAKVFPNPEMVKAFENLFKMATTTQTTDLESVAIETSTATASAENALSSSIENKKILELLETAPPQDQHGFVNADYIQFRNTYKRSTEAGQLNWSYLYGGLQFTHLGGLIQNIGTDTIIHINNVTGSTITKGTLLKFSGISSSNLNVDLFLADGSAPSQYIIGIASEDILNNAEGHATEAGYVRDINASGSLYSETWSNGTILYGHPTISGGLTSVKPTAPNISIPVAVVLDNSSTTGALYVRITPEQQLYYGSFYDSTNQTAVAINTPYAITYNTSNASEGVSIGTPTSRIICANSGLYEFSFSAQVTSGSASSKTLWFWPRKNGVDISSSAMKASISGSNVTLSVSRSMFFSMNAGDYLEAMWSTDDVNVTIEAAPSTAFAPATPSSIMTVAQISQ